MRIHHTVPALVLSLSIALVSVYIATFNASFDPLVISIIIGMFVGNILEIRELAGQGVESAVKLLLPVGIALYGTQLVFSELRPGILAGILCIAGGLFGLTLLLSRVFSLNQKLSILLATGVAVCGASAIAVISPLIGARKEDTSISVISVMMLGLTGMIFFPMLYDILSLTREEFNFLAGSTLPMLGQVRVAAGSVCPECLGVALKVKLVRVSLLVFWVTIAVFLSGKDKRRVNVPWFVVVFIILALLANFTRFLTPVMDYLKSSSTFLLSAALAAIGTSVDFDAIVEEGVAPLGVIFFSWSMIILLMYLARNLF